MRATTLNQDQGDIDNTFGKFHDFPLLTAADEREVDLRKWASVRSCMRLMLDDEQSRHLISELCLNCKENPPQVENFARRGAFFHLRKDIADMLPGHRLAGPAAELVSLLDNDASGQQRMAAMERLGWPTTLTIGLATVVLRQLGFELKDAMADALTEWIAPWQTLVPRTDSKLACNLHFSVLRYQDSRDKLVIHNVRLALKLARDNQRRSVPLGDLVQEGLSGLVRAAEKFDFRMGYRFSTYAYNWINQHIQLACANNGSLIHHPANVTGDINRLHKARMQLLEKSGREPDHPALAAATGFKLEKVARLRQLTNITIGLDEPVGEINSNALEAILADPDSDCYEELADAPRLARLVATSLEQLSEIEQQVITGRWGLGGKQALTLVQMADQLNVSSEWVRQLEKAALEKLRQDAVLKQVLEDVGV